MTTTASIAELQDAGVLLDTSEAVAIAQQLIQALRHSSEACTVQPPGPPTAWNVILNPDGSVSCPACGTTPAICEIAIFLDALLPAGSPRVPGGLRFVIARGLLEVDVPPFDSLEDFSQALSRHEHGRREDVVRRLLQRAAPACAVACAASADRRHGRALATDLRRALREADARLYAQQTAVSPPAAPPRIRARTRARAVPGIAACLGLGLMLISAGDYVRRPAQGAVAPAAARPPAVGRTTGAVSTPTPVGVLPGVRAAGATPGNAGSTARPQGVKVAARTSAVAAGRRPARAVHPAAAPRDPGSVPRAARPGETGVVKARPRPLSPGDFGRQPLRSLRRAISTRVVDDL